MNKLYNNRGYTLLFASLTAALVLGVAVFILSVSRRQAVIAALAKNSTYSIYAADSALECVTLRRNDLYGDGISIPILDAEKMSSTTIDGGSFEFKCKNGSSAIVQMTRTDPTPSLFDPLIPAKGIHQAIGNMDTGGGTCAIITVTIGSISDDISNTDNLKKIIDVSGYNLCTGSAPNWTSPNLVERAMRLTLTGSW